MRLMTILRNKYFATALLMGAVAAPAVHANSDPLLWYTSPAAYWTEALPVGNGSLGGMVFGGTDRERIQFNHDTLWTGTVHAYHREGAHEHLGTIRELLWQDKQKEAEAFAMENFMSVPLRQMFYQAFGDLILDFPGHEAATEYRRELNLATAVARTEYTVAETRYTRETYSSYPAGVLVTRIQSDQPGGLNFTLGMESPHKDHAVEASADGFVELSGKVQQDGISFNAKAGVKLTGGSMRISGSNLVVEGADEALVILSAATSYRNFRDISADPALETSQRLGDALRKSADALMVAHVADHARLFNQVSIDLGSSEAAELPTHDRMRRADKSKDPALAALLFQYGRYLLIASSRPGSQPANLQGIWNDMLNPSWGSKYTMNINFAMNYWPSEVTGLSESADPLLDMYDELAISGAETARAHYDADGWVVHHNTDLWRGTAPINHANHGIWPGGAAWIGFQLWERYRYTGDKTFLRDRAYPLLRGAAEFYADILIEDPQTGKLITGPSNSPEHGGLVMGPAMDRQLIRSLFLNTSTAARTLGVDEQFAVELEQLQARILPDQIGQHGQLQEWLQDMDDPENDHRHVSHLWDVFPGYGITWSQPELMRAAIRSLDMRGDGGTGWALAWKIALWARMLDADRAHSLVLAQLNLVEDTPEKRTMSGPGGSYPNLLGAHPPFQIDGNFGTTAGIVEMLLQSHTNEIVLLPALPSAWPDGSVTGLRARGGFVVDLSWQDGVLQSAKVHAPADAQGRLRYGDRVLDLSLKAGQSRDFGPGLREMAAYRGHLPPLDLAVNLMNTQIRRFQDFLPEGEVVPARWGYILGLFASSMIDLSAATQMEEPLVYGAAIIEPLIAQDGVISGYRKEEFNIDHIRPGVAVLQLYERTGEERYRKAADNLREQLARHPRTADGGFWHKQIYPDQMWLDGLYMAMPFLAQYAQMFDRPEDFDEVVKQIRMIDAKAYDPETGLYFHAWDATGKLDWSDPQTGLAKNFWSRGIGWYAMALVDVLDYLPADHAGVPHIRQIIGRVAAGIARWQDSRTGLWWQVTDAGARPGNYLEGTVAPMFVYTLTKAVNRGYISREQYSETILSAWKGIADVLLDVDTTGHIHLAQCCQVAGLNLGRDGSFEYYISEPIVRNDLKGVGPMLWACIEMDRYLSRK